MAIEFCLTRGGAKDSSTNSRQEKTKNVSHVNDESIPEVRSKVTISLQRRRSTHYVRHVRRNDCTARLFAASGHRGELWDPYREKTARVVEKPGSAVDSSIRRRTRGHNARAMLSCRMRAVRRVRREWPRIESSATCRGLAGFGSNDRSGCSAATDPGPNQNLCLCGHARAALCAAT